MSARRRAVVLVIACVAACADPNGYDPTRYPSGAPVILVDPEIEPLPPSPKRRMRDPRGTPALDAGADGHTPPGPHDEGS